MRPSLLLSLACCLCLTACADHVGDSLVVADSPKPPVNQPDTGAIDGPVTVTTPVNPGGPATVGNGSSGTGGQSGGSGAVETGGAAEEPSSPTLVDGGGGQGGQGGQPVPEPGTLLLVGSGLAGAALLRRRRQRSTES